MPWVTDEQVNAVRERERQLGELFQTFQSRIDALESKPAVDAMTQDWQAGRQYAQQKGYSADETARLEQMMVSRGIARHADAIAVDPSRPSGRLWPLGAMPADEMKALMEGDEATYEQLSIRRALGQE